MKKIMYIIDNNINIIGGSTKSTFTIITEMQKLNKYNVYLCMPETDRKLELLSDDKIFTYPEHKYKNKLINVFFHKMKEIQKIIKQVQPDIIHAQDPQGGIIIAMLKKFGKISKDIECIYTDRQLYETYSIYYKVFFNLMIKGLNKVICTTNINKEQWEKHTKARYVECVSNVLDEKWYTYDENRERKEEKEKLIIGFAARFDTYKRWDTVKSICEEFKNNEQVQFRFCIATGTEQNKLEALQYTEEIKQILGDRVIIQLNATAEEMEEFYYYIDIFVLTSQGESFGRTLIEAMARRCVVFGTNSGGVPDVIHNKEFLFEVNDVKDICNKILGYANSKEKLQKDKKYFEQYVKDRFSVDKLREQLDNIYTN